MTYPKDTGSVCGFLTRSATEARLTEISTSTRYDSGSDCREGLSAHAPGVAFYEDIKKTNAAFDALKLDSDTKLHVLDLWNEMCNADGSLKRGLFTLDNVHLTQDGGHDLHASKLKPFVQKVLAKK